MFKPQLSTTSGSGLEFMSVSESVSHSWSFILYRLGGTPARFACQPRCSLRSHSRHLGLWPRCLCCIFLNRANSLCSFALLGLRPRAFYHMVKGANSLRSFALRFGLRPHLRFCFAFLADMFSLTPYLNPIRQCHHNWC